MAIDLDTANTMLTEWLNAEKAILKNQSYKIGDKEFTKVNMSYVRENVAYWEKKVLSLTPASEGGRKGVRMKKAVYRG
ncbi:DUF6148 family protein [Sulfurovum sp. zt1-1]|uniref:DUF6148 family protein n=1 Tax=Sulfurovum zhangzhouensis TaxID=3019067 RepID=A0ABT7QZ29_9BACT|nr:DUF6148 family protein [Sulfurovum zhangzhouensis]MDM5272089.1 DUF6148 family protein [Sulfurovum zhangzhouensis]